MRVGKPPLSEGYRRLYGIRKCSKTPPSGVGVSPFRVFLRMLNENGLSYDEMKQRLDGAKNCSFGDIYFERVGRQDVVEARFPDGRRKRYEIN